MTHELLITLGAWTAEATEPGAKRAASFRDVHGVDIRDEHPHVQWPTQEGPAGRLFCLAEHPRHGKAGNCAHC